MPSATAMVRSARSKKREITPMRHANNSKQSVPATPRLRLPRWPTTWSAESSNLSPYVPGGVGHGGAMSRVRLVGVGPGHPGLATVQAVEAVKEADVIRNYDGCGTGLLHLAPSNADIAPLDSVDEVIRLARKAATYGLRGDALLVLGPGVDMSERLDTLSKRPLHGRRILITRARHQVDPFRRELVDLGAAVVEIPTLEIRRLPIDDRVRNAIKNLDRTALVIFASANAVDIFFQMLTTSDLDARTLHNSKVCAIGQETADALAGHGLRPELVTSEYTAEGLANALEGWEMKGMRVLVPRAEVARDALPSLLANRGAEVEILPVYSAVCPAEATPALLRLFDGEGVDVITFTSSSTVVNFVRAFPEDRLPAILGDAEIACMGPVTADTARKLGLQVAIVAREYTTHGLVTAIAESAARK